MKKTCSRCGNTITTAWHYRMDMLLVCNPCYVIDPVVMDIRAAFASNAAEIAAETNTYTW